jgi:hypothetical protein
VVQTAGVRRVTWSSAGAQVAGPELEGTCLELRLTVVDEMVRYEYSLDGGQGFKPLGESTKLRFSWWKGARPALFNYTTAEKGGYVDFDWFRVSPGPK